MEICKVKTEICEPEFVAVKMEYDMDGYNENETDCLNNDSLQSADEHLRNEINVIDSLAIDEPQQQVHGKSLVQCDQCNKLFDRKYNLRRHVTQVHEAKKVDVRVITENNMINFIIIKEPQHKIDEKRVVQCDQCNKLFKNKSCLRRHVREVHKSKKLVKSIITDNAINSTIINDTLRIAPKRTVLQCNQCNKLFDRNYNLRRHIAMVHKSNEQDESIITKEADGSIITEDNAMNSISLNESQDNFAEQSVLQCDQCNKLFNRSYNLKRHMQVHEAKKVDESIITKDNVIKSITINETQDKVDKVSALQCNQCNKLFKSNSSLRRHVTEVHKNKKQNEGITEKADESIITEDNAINSIRSIEEQNEVDEKSLFECNQCNKLFQNNYRLKRHVTRVHERKKVECEVCHEFFAKKSNLLVHYDSVHPGFMTHSCNECSKTFDKRKNLLRHIRSVHRNTVFECAICQKTFTNKTYLRLHITGTHEQVKGVECDTCKKTFRHKTYLRIHIDAVHKRLRNFECPICHKVYGFEGYLKKHIKGIHGTIIKNHECEICKKKFSHKSNLTKHVDRSHKNIRAFECEICHATFKQKAHKLVHIDTVHEQKKNFFCEYCGKNFGRKDNMLMHVKIVHLKLKKHECQICKKTFRDRHYLTKHMNTVHKDIVKDITIDFRNNEKENTADIS
ncbi:zinc finger protein 2 homolog [Trichogramma pretiosum]|uniref:zinc finger protein 2 homolog n=1 Tax=Trichogramma pretiosum TaxID=7493 RepID=UPI000C719577|nr:zinc finger protein 2 homolog [Trichogramma pretiosum]